MGDDPAGEEAAGAGGAGPWGHSRPPYTEPRFHSATHPFVARPTGSGTVRYSRFLQSLATGRGRCVLVLPASQGTTPPQARCDRTLGTVHKRRGGVHTLRRGGGQRRGAWRSTTAGARGTAAPKLASAWATLTLGTARARMRGTGGMACRNAHHATHWGEARVLTDTPTGRRRHGLLSCPRQCQRQSSSLLLPPPPPRMRQLCWGQGLSPARTRHPQGEAPQAFRRRNLLASGDP